MSTGLDSSKAALFVLRRGDQCGVAVWTVVALVIVAAHFYGESGWLGEQFVNEAEPSKAVVFQVDVNTATWPELTLLPRVGETLAQRIIETRDSAPYYSTADLDRRVKGIGPVTAALLEPYLLPLPGDLATGPAAPTEALAQAR
jgi:competence protein ComEA